MGDRGGKFFFRVDKGSEEVGDGHLWRNVKGESKCRVPTAEADRPTVDPPTTDAPLADLPLCDGADAEQLNVRIGACQRLARDVQGLKVLGRVYNQVC